MIQNACEKHLCAWRSTHYKSNYMKNRCFHNLSKSTLALLTYCGYGSRFYILLPNRRQDYIFYNHYFLKKFLLSFMYQKRKRTPPPTHTHKRGRDSPLISPCNPTSALPVWLKQGSYRKSILSFASAVPSWKLCKLYFSQFIHKHVSSFPLEWPFTMTTYV